MDRPFVVESAAFVRGVIAAVILGARAPERTLGSIRLKPHQSSSLPRLESALAEFGGALLCDEVGMGKTFVALAIARNYPRVVVAAPAGLREMWRVALAQTGVQAEFVTLERLSRGPLPASSPDLLIVDEAHHVRNPSTRRYRAIARAARNSRVLLLTATPIHNRRDDLVALLSLFLGARARNLHDNELARCVVRREKMEMPGLIGVPRIAPVVGCDVPDDPSLVARLLSLPPAVPPRDGESGGALINRGLLHQWSSSDAALKDALRRRLAKAEALRASLRAGRYPDARELEAWTFVDGALQLAFAELLAPPTPEPDALLDAVSTHADALALLNRDFASVTRIDQAKTDRLRRIWAEHPGARIVAFAQYASTVSALFCGLARFAGVAVLTASGARVAGGKLSRNDAIARFAPRANHARAPSRAEGIELLLTTDLLSEGVNLQDAEVVVHLDLPWTAARMEQRVGRVARMGSTHPCVQVYQFRPPASTETILRGTALVSSKWALASRQVGANRHHPLARRDNTESPAPSIPSRAERLRSILAGWLNESAADKGRDDSVVVGAVHSRRPLLPQARLTAAFLAAGYLGGLPLLLYFDGTGMFTDLDAQIEACLLAGGSGTDARVDDYEAACAAIEDWAACNAASEAAGAASSFPTLSRRLLDRIDSMVQRAPPHRRVLQARAAATARAFVSVPHGAAIESELQELADSPLVDDAWLEAIAALDPGRKVREKADNFRLHAVLLLRP